jgi:hypothetical protein
MRCPKNRGAKNGDVLHRKLPPFPGTAYDPKIDGLRLLKQYEHIRDYMLTMAESDRRFRHRSEGFRTLQEIEQATGHLTASVSAQLRNLKKPEFGSYLLEKRRRAPDGGTWEYKLMAPMTISTLSGEQIPLM